VEWATILLNLRQAFTMTVTALFLAGILRGLHRILVIASRPALPTPAP